VVLLIQQIERRKLLLRRLKLVGAGFALVAVGSLRIMADQQVVQHSNGQPVFSWGLIAGGILCLVLAPVPISWIAKAAEIPHAKFRGHRKDSSSGH
jgi:hypothetical protein